MIQDIISESIDLIIVEYYGFDTRGVNSPDDGEYLPQNHAESLTFSMQALEYFVQIRSGDYA